jgi:protein-S-isoprenylcysteine O-methyltransferase Ste14
MFLSILTLTLFFVIYGVIHSLLAGLPVKNWTRRTFGPGADRWYRLAYNVVAVITFLPLFPLLALLPDQTLYVVPAPGRWLLLAGQVLALAGLGLAFLQTEPLHFLGLAQLWTEPSATKRASGQLVVTGFYYWVRHPLYFFSMLFLWLTPVMTVNLLVTYFLISLYFYVGSIYEERRLLAEFGSAYREYQRCVPRLIPWRGRCYKPQTGWETS